MTRSCERGADIGISKSEVSRICQDLDTDVAALGNRTLRCTASPHVSFDAAYCKARVNDQVAAQAIVVAVEAEAAGRREVLGMDVGDSEERALRTA